MKEKYKKKKILFFLYRLVGGGAERTVVNIINNLDESKYEIMLVLGTDKDNDYIKLLNNNIQIEVLRAKSLINSIFKLRKLIIKVKPDLMFSTISGNNYVLSIAKLLSFTKIPVIVRESNNRTGAGKIKWIHRLLTRLLYNRADKVVALSVGVKDDLTENFSIDSQKIKVIYNPIEVKEIQKYANDKLEHKRILDTNEKIIISVGRLVEQKNYPLLLNAFKQVRKQVNSKLIILGKGPLEKELKDLAKNLGVIEDTVFLGFKENPYKYLNKADLFVLSSSWEGFGHVIVEAMASGTPVVSTNCPSGPSEIIGENEYGVLIQSNTVDELSKEIVKMLTNDNLRAYYKNQGLNRAETFEASKIVYQYEELFISLIEKDY